MSKPNEIGPRHHLYKVCPICGHVGWCCTTNYKDIVYLTCKRDTLKCDINGFKYIGDSKKQGNSKYVDSNVHGEFINRSYQQEGLDPKKDTTLIRFSDSKINEIHKKLLSMLILEDYHREYLNKAGINDMLIEYFKIKSYPEVDFLRKQNQIQSKNKLRWQLAQELVKSFGDLTGYPGAYVKEGEKNRYWTLAGCGGIMFSIPNVYGEYVMGQIKIDNPPPGFRGKYMMFSSDGKDNGCTPSSRVGMCFPKVLGDTYVCYITEGIKKAIVTSDRLGSLAITMQGVNSWGELLEKNQRGERLIDVLKNKYGVRMFIIAFDKDKYQNNKVMEQQKVIMKALHDEGFIIGLAEWDSYCGKGMDDVLVNGYKPMLHPVPESDFE